MPLCESLCGSQGVSTAGLECGVIQSLLLNAKGRPESRPPVCFSGDQNLCSTLNNTFERLLLPTRSITKRMFAELSLD